MLPLNYADKNTELIIKKVGGTDAVKQHLADMGFVAGQEVSIVNTVGGNVIVNVKNVRVAISEELAKKIMI